MSDGIIGSEKIGATAARLFARAGHEVAVSNSRGPETLWRGSSPASDRGHAPRPSKRPPASARRCSRRSPSSPTRPRRRSGSQARSSWTRRTITRDGDIDFGAWDLARCWPGRYRAPGSSTLSTPCATRRSAPEAGPRPRRGAPRPIRGRRRRASQSRRVGADRGDRLRPGGRGHSGRRPQTAAGVPDPTRR